MQPRGQVDAPNLVSRPYDQDHVTVAAVLTRDSDSDTSSATAQAFAVYTPVVCAYFAPACAYLALVCAFVSLLSQTSRACTRVSCLRGPVVRACPAPACACLPCACVCALSCISWTRSSEFPNPGIDSLGSSGYGGVQYFIQRKGIGEKKTKLCLYRLKA